MAPSPNLDAISLLTSQHDVVDDLIGKIEESSGDERAKLFEEMADNLAAHARIEETLFYPTIMAKQTESLLLESTEEHLAIKRVLADMLDLDVDDPRFDAKLSVLKETVRHHARDEEEGDLFHEARKLLSADELEALGGELASTFEALLPREPRRDVPFETKVAASLPAAA